MPSHDDFDLTYISLGAGRQSTAMAICSALGLYNVPKASIALFADTGDEPPNVYEHLSTFTKWLNQHGMEVKIVSAGKLSDELLGIAAPVQQGFPVGIPAWTADGVPLRRQCTKHYKLQPLEKEIRALLGFKKGERIKGKAMGRALIGISMDEVGRMKPSQSTFITNCYPLILGPKHPLRVEDCIRICEEHLGYVPGKSACRYCPYHDNQFWLDLKTDLPREFEEACKVDEAIRHNTKGGEEKPIFIHQSCQPLRGIDFQALLKDPNQMDLFQNACDGYCGV